MSNQIIPRKVVTVDGDLRADLHKIAKEIDASDAAVVRAGLRDTLKRFRDGEIEMVNGAFRSVKPVRR